MSHDDDVNSTFPPQLFHVPMSNFIKRFFLVQDRLKPLPVEMFGEHVQNMHSDRDKWFELEYNVSQRDHQDFSFTE